MAVSREQKRKKVLSHAIATGDVVAIQGLIDGGLNINERNSLGMTVLMTAASWGQAESVRMLIDAGADLADRDREGMTALHWTALHWAATHAGYAECVRILLDSGADPNAKNINEDTAVELAKRRGHDDIVALLTDYEMHVGVAEAGGQSEQKTATPSL